MTASTHHFSRRLLQAINLLLAVVTLLVAGTSLVSGTDSPVYGETFVPSIPALDSNLRFLGGTGVGIALILMWITPRIEDHTALFRGVWGCALLGGFGRLLSAVVVGRPPGPILAFTLIEVLVIPLLIVWQYAVVRGRLAPGV